MISTEQALEVEVGLLCCTDKVMADTIPVFFLVIVRREIRNVRPVVIEVEVCVIRVD